MTAPMIPSYTVDENVSLSRRTCTDSSNPKTVTGCGLDGSTSVAPSPRSIGPTWTGDSLRSSAIRG